MNATANDKWTARPYTQHDGDRIKLALKEAGITVEALRKVFPSRPTTHGDAVNIISWIQSQTASPTPAPAQGALVDRKDKSGKALSVYYAVTLPGEDKLRFFRVKAGRKEGFYFVEEQAGPQTYPVKNYTRKTTILNTIRQDAEGAMKRYGQEIGNCGMCHLPLTDKESRDRGIGPICADK